MIGQPDNTEQSHVLMDSADVFSSNMSGERPLRVPDEMLTGTRWPRALHISIGLQNVSP